MRARLRSALPTRSCADFGAELSTRDLLALLPPRDVPQWACETAGINIVNDALELGVRVGGMCVLVGAAYPGPSLTGQRAAEPKALSRFAAGWYSQWASVFPVP